MDHLAGRTDLHVGGDWMKIWSLNVPPKVKTCIWRACRDCLPTRLAIRSRGVTCTPLCVVCNNGNESCWHTFLTCPSSVSCWRKTHLWNIIEGIMVNAVSFRDFFFKACTQLSDSQLSAFSMIIWSIWKMRNQKLWENLIEQPDQVVQRAENLLHTWRCARGPGTAGAAATPVADVRWLPPPPGWFKCNVDASINASSNRVSVGCCLRAADGAFVKAMTSWLPASLSPAEAECWGLLQAIHWLEEHNVHHVILEMDCQQVVLDVLNDKSIRNEYGCLIGHCKARLVQHNDYKVVFVKRQANSSAHALAKAATNYAPRTTLLSMPFCIHSIIMNELP